MQPSPRYRRQQRVGSFNPHSSFRPSATFGLAIFVYAVLKFQSSLELLPECNVSGLGDSPPIGGFNPHSSFRPSATKELYERIMQSRVSILTRAFARVQPSPRYRRQQRVGSFNPHSSFRPSATFGLAIFVYAVLKFQSSLELLPECNVSGLGDSPPIGGFNPHSSFRPSATKELYERIMQSRVSILTRAFARVQRGVHNERLRGALRFQSSLELSPECNAKGSGSRPAPPRPFQSSLELSPECNSLGNLTASRPVAFQSSLELSPECNATPPRRRGPWSGCFNPHSSFRPSATLRAMVLFALRMIAFQSSLELSPECNPERGHGLHAEPLSFNPHSSFRPSATGQVVKKSQGGYTVSILTRAFARVQPGGALERLARDKVSILTRAFARVQLDWPVLPPCNWRGFNPHSSFRPSATAGPGPGGRVHPVSILTRAFARVQLHALRQHSYFHECFNPHSSFRPSATPTIEERNDEGFSFNPHSSFRPSATGRKASPLFIFSLRFQSSLELSPECNRRGPWSGWRGMRFQSSLELSPECNPHRKVDMGTHSRVSILTRAFARVQREVLARAADHSPVSILTRAFARVQPVLEVSISGGVLVSILTRAFARVQRPGKGGGCSPGLSFNPHSSFRPSATASF